MRIAYLVAGAGDMYCGSCMRDNRLAARLLAQQRDVVLLPLYTPIKTDETDVSDPHVHFGGINVYLQERWSLFRHVPRFLHRLLDWTVLLRRVGRLAASTSAAQLGTLTVSMLDGPRGPLRKELDRLIQDLANLKPSIVHLPNLMFLGIAAPLRKALGVPVVCSLAGEDIFLDALVEPYRAQAFERIRRHAADVQAFVAPTEYYGAHAAAHFDLPADRVTFACMGINPADFLTPAAPPPESPTIGYLARICPQKGLHVLVEAFLQLRRAGRNCRLRIAGYLGPSDREYFEGVLAELRGAGFGDDVDVVGETDRAGKIEFLKSLHVFSVPATYAEAKGFYVLEAMAAGVPVVQPRRGSFPELIEATGGGLLYEDDAAAGLAGALSRMLDNPALRSRLARDGQSSVLTSFTDDVMADQTWSIYEEIILGAPVTS